MSDTNWNMLTGAACVVLGYVAFAVLNAIRENRNP